MGARLSAHQNRKRVSSRLQPSIKTTTSHSGSPSTASKTASSNKAPLTSSQSSDGIIRNGRKFHNETSSVYWFPNDDEEMDRLVGVRNTRQQGAFQCIHSIPILNSNILLWRLCSMGMFDGFASHWSSLFLFLTDPAIEIFQRKRLKMARFPLKTEPRSWI